MKIPGINKLLFKIFGHKLLLQKLDQDFSQNMNIAELSKRFEDQMRYKGFARAILSTMMHFPMTTSRDVFLRVGQLSIPKLLLWGENDKTIPFSLHTEVISSLPGVEFHAIPDAGHIPHFETPERVNPLILDFLLK